MSGTCRTLDTMIPSSPLPALLASNRSSLGAAGFTERSHDVTMEPYQWGGTGSNLVSPAGLLGVPDSLSDLQAGDA